MKFINCSAIGLNLPDFNHMERIFHTFLLVSGRESLFPENEASGRQVCIQLWVDGYIYIYIISKSI